MTCFSEGVIWTSFGCSASSLFADRVTNPCFLTSGYSDTDRCTCAVHRASGILAVSTRGAQWPRPKSTECSSCSYCDPQTHCLSWGVLAVTSEGWPGLPADCCNPLLSLPSWGITHHRAWMCVGQAFAFTSLCFPATLKILGFPVIQN